MVERRRFRRVSRTPRDGERVAIGHVALTCVTDGLAHAVPEAELAAACDRYGQSRAVCGHLVTAAPMTQPTGAPCRSCYRPAAPSS